MQFHESNLVPENLSYKRLKLQFNDKPNSTKLNTVKEISQPIHSMSETKYVTSIGSRSQEKSKSVIFDDEEESITSFQ